MGLADKLAGDGNIAGGHGFRAGIRAPVHGGGPNISVVGEPAFLMIAFHVLRRDLSGGQVRAVGQRPAVGVDGTVCAHAALPDLQGNFIAVSGIKEVNVQTVVRFTGNHRPGGSLRQALRKCCFCIGIAVAGQGTGIGEALHLAGLDALQGKLLAVQSHQLPVEVFLKGVGIPVQIL